MKGIAKTLHFTNIDYSLKKWAKIQKKDSRLSIVSLQKNINKGEFHIGSLLEKSLNFESGNLTSGTGIILYR